MSKVVIFQIGNEEYAIPMDYVVSIEKSSGPTPLPQMPVYVKGIVEIREQIIPVVDLQYIFYSRFLHADENCRLIVLQLEGMPIGLLVNEAKEIVEIPSEKIKQVSLIITQKTEFLSGIASLHARLLPIINPKNLITSLEGINKLCDYMETL